MKRLMVLLLAAVFVLSGAAFAADVKDKAGADVKAKSGDVKAKTIKEAPPKVPRMTAVGTVMEISDKALKLDRIAKDKKEIMDFALQKPAEGVKAGDKVTVTYVVKDGKNVAQKVKKAKEPTVKKTEPGAPVKDKVGKEVKAKSGGEVESKKK